MHKIIDSLQAKGRTNPTELWTQLSSPSNYFCCWSLICVVGSGSLNRLLQHVLILLFSTSFVLQNEVSGLFSLSLPSPQQKDPWFLAGRVWCLVVNSCRLGVLTMTGSHYFSVAGHGYFLPVFKQRPPHTYWIWNLISYRQGLTSPLLDHKESKLIFSVGRTAINTGKHTPCIHSHSLLSDEITQI